MSYVFFAICKIDSSSKAESIIKNASQTSREHDKHYKSTSYS